MADIQADRGTEPFDFNCLFCIVRDSGVDALSFRFNWVCRRDDTGIADTPELREPKQSSVDVQKHPRKTKNRLALGREC